MRSRNVNPSTETFGAFLAECGLRIIALHCKRKYRPTWALQSAWRLGQRTTNQLYVSTSLEALAYYFHVRHNFLKFLLVLWTVWNRSSYPGQIAHILISHIDSTKWCENKWKWPTSPVKNPHSLTGCINNIWTVPTLTLAPIWLPHWPACRCTISLMLP
jgi:hypothetical protein